MRRRVLIPAWTVLFAVAYTGFACRPASAERPDIVWMAGGHAADVTSVAFSPDGSIIASGSGDSSIKLWRVSDGELIRTLEGHTEWVNSVAFSPDGSMIASGSRDGTIKLWRMSDGWLIRTLRGHTGEVNSIAFSPDGSLVASVSSDRTTKLWGVSNGSLMKTLEAHTRGVTSVAFAPDGKTLASGSWDGTVGLWRVSDLVLTRTFDVNWPVLCVVFSPDGKTLATGSGDGTVKLRRISDGSAIGELIWYGWQVRSISFSADGSVLASANYRTLNLWRVSDGALVRSYGEETDVSAVAFSPDRSLLTYGRGDGMLVLMRNPFASPPQPAGADMDGDGSVTIKDVAIAIRIATGLVETSERLLRTGDLNRDGKIDIWDAMQTLRAALGLETGGKGGWESNLRIAVPLSRFDDRIKLMRRKWIELAPSYEGSPFAELPNVRSPYAAGKLHPDFVRDGLNMVNFVRFLAYLPDDVVLDDRLMYQAQHGALLLAATGQLTHEPPRPPDMPTELYQLGYRSTTSSNIGWGYFSLADFVEGCMDDAGIPPLGHRRWILNPPLKRTGFGFLPPFVVVQAHDDSRTQSFSYDFVAWPSPGPFPLEFFRVIVLGGIFPSLRIYSGRLSLWSVSLNPRRFKTPSESEVEVVLKRVSDRRVWRFNSPTRVDNGSSLYEIDTQGFGIPICIMFRPNVEDYNDGDVFTVEISGLHYNDGTPTKIRYEVCFFQLGH